MKHKPPQTKPQPLTGEQFNELRSRARAAEARNPFIISKDDLALELADAQALRARHESGQKTMADFWVDQGWFKFSSGSSPSSMLALVNGVPQYVRLKNGSWKEQATRAAAVKFLVEQVLKKNPRDVTIEDFDANRIGAFLCTYYLDSPYDALKEAGYDFHPWEMKKTPNGLFDKKENRIAATKWLVTKLGKSPKDLTADDFCSNRLRGLLNHHSDSPCKTLKEAGYHIGPLEIRKRPAGFFDKKEKRIAAINRLIKKLSKDPRDLTGADFRSKRLGGLLRNYYGNSQYKALTEAGYAFHLWEMKKTPNGFFDKKENRIVATKWLADKFAKNPRDITAQDFQTNRLSGLLSSRYFGSPYAALKEAGIVSEQDEAYMRSSHHTH